MEKKQQEVKKETEQYEKEKKDHEAEVTDLFENIGTLKFVKELRFFKKQWQEQKTDKKRKKIAAAMANATKGWVSDGETIN